LRLKNKVALVTGGGRGIGKAISLAYAREGAKIAICARMGAELQETAKDIRKLGGKCLETVCDVSQEESVASIVKELEKGFGAVDVLVNNAGVLTRPTPIAELEIRKWDHTIAVNLRGSFLMTRAVLPLMTCLKGSSIINISSMIGCGVYANFSAYTASKWGIEGLTQTLAAELRSSGIRVNSVDPGYVATKLTGCSGSRPESVTDAFLYLAADESKGITGKMLSSAGWKSQIK
jgi:NAD(P)-dependent dehydrogenase (short-subunit alcohol dehydrogenase family)